MAFIAYKPHSNCGNALHKKKSSLCSIIDTDNRRKSAPVLNFNPELSKMLNLNRFSRVHLAFDTETMRLRIKFLKQGELHNGDCGLKLSKMSDKGRYRICLQGIKTMFGLVKKPKTHLSQMVPSGNPNRYLYIDLKDKYTIMPKGV